MSQHKNKKGSVKTEKQNFFSQQSAPAAPADRASNDNEDPKSDDSKQSLRSGAPLNNQQITKADLSAALEALSHKLITTWQHTADSMRKDIQELGKRTTNMEDKCDEFATAHNDLATTVEHREYTWLVPRMYLIIHQRINSSCRPP
ncbi:Hypothetical predicted protein [Pelobates cultripes]|uniref:Uncharacterized protein n=1 Tax=Pelobates cultripes TaxID=61616 RepID=A0AAD1W2X5_PELCU|nr:Hypothetical predicted protein [Pelobates cultripes]